jgi:NADPH-dependent ferric siderophore reductase
MASSPFRARVESTEWITPRMVRIVVSGDELASFECGEFSDHYVKVQLPPPGAPYAAPFDMEDVRERFPRELWPRTRSYTVREWDPQQRRLTLDFVVHGDVGIAGPWATSSSSRGRAAPTRPTRRPTGT